MPTEYKLSYTGREIDEKLGKIDRLESTIDNTLDMNGNAWFAGDVYVGGTSQNDAMKLIKENDVATNEDIMEFVSEMGIADPVTTPDGSIYTNANGDIYVL